MDIDQTKVYAGEQIIRALCSGERFNGLGKEAEHLIRAAAVGADANAKCISKETTRTQEAFFEMHDRVRDQFVLDILGFGSREDEHGLTIDGPMSPQQAAYKLVDSVWHAYIEWAQAARLQEMREAGMAVVKARIEG